MRPLSKAAQAEILEIAARRGEAGLRPEDVWNRAREPRSALHHYIEWDRTRAAKAHQLEQCRELIQRVRVILIRHDNPPVAVRALLSVDVEGARAYRTVQAISESADLKRQVMAQMKVDIDRLTIRYGIYEEFWAALAAAGRRKRKAA